MSGTPRGGCLSGRPGTLCETSNFHPRFCTHTAHDGPPVGSDSLGGVISAIRRGDMDVPAVRPASTDHIRDRVAVADPHERDGARRAPGTRILPPTTPRAASHRSDAS